ncbi:hypothetical protein LXP63_14580 [Yersinia pestis subsp. pestis]|uniref:hypothetical protein n=1 Tax=Yersinia pestis TaxID=632 RepID=UPI00046E41D4|nr:hypothetical protein [Yersinia pestis]MBP1376044.1 hypothetical protein [Yersinia pestis subsp. pestis]MBP1397133.1 hypothetical protein [Yersinia pestis subsp. pestis]MCF2964507.1 hypothetical protein [Yersinia pestis subsp. pestis]PVF22093.1 hypothetical protein A9324_21135 [Yersinia pestis]PVF31071.1 hypothetical protein A9317_15260 [Yersinia pestis]
MEKFIPRENRFLRHHPNSGVVAVAFREYLKIIFPCWLDNANKVDADLFFSRGAVWRKGFGNAGKIGCLPEKRMRKYPVGEIANHP